MTKKVDINELIRQSLYESADETQDNSVVEEGVFGSTNPEWLNKKSSIKGGVEDAITWTKEKATAAKEAAMKAGKSAKEWADDNPKAAMAIAGGTAITGALGAGAAALRRKRANK